MLRVYHSNRLDVLEALMEFIVERERLDDPFEPEMILVQSTGMAQWLQMTLSQKFGIAANIDFPLPASFIWDMFVRVLPEIPKESAFNKQSMSWKLMTLLPQLLEREDFTLLRHYLTDDSDKRKLFQLSSKAADLFDQYLVYRPDWLAQWETGHLVEGLGEAQAWQAPLWKALVEYTHELGQPRWHRANLYQRFIETLESATTCPPGLPSRVFICGISALPPVYLQALQALGKHIEIHLLFTNPCRYYWGDIKDPAYLAKLLTRQRRHSFEDRELPLFRDSENAGQLFNSDGEQDVGNPLLASWGKLGRDYIYLLSDLESSQELDAFVDVTPDNLLHNIQSDILELENRAVAGVNIEEFSRSDNKRPLDPLDSSITFHVCHSPQREVEVLHDRLLAMLEGFFMDHPSVRLVVIDTFQRVREGGGAQYSYQSDYEEIRPFKEFTDIHDVALILVHHTRKNTESENSFDRISGTNGLLGAADGAFLLYREKGRVILDQTGRDLPGQRMILDFDPQRCLWTVVSREAGIAEPPEPLLDLIDQVIGGGWQGTATELLERLRRLDPELPYRANTLTRKLNALTRRLKEEKGIEYWKSRRPESRQLTFLRTEDEEEDEERDDDDGDDDDDDSAPAGEIPSLPSLESESGGDGDG